MGKLRLEDSSEMANGAQSLKMTHAGLPEIPRVAGPAGAPEIPALYNSGPFGPSAAIMEGRRPCRAAVTSSPPVELCSFDILLS